MQLNKQAFLNATNNISFVTLKVWIPVGESKICNVPGDLVHTCDLIRIINICDLHRSKIDKVTLSALRTRQSLVKGERLVRHEMRAVLIHMTWPPNMSYIVYKGSAV